MTTDATIDEGTSTTKKKTARKSKASAPEGDAIPIRSTVGGIQHRLVRCVGISPLLMNRMSDEQLEAIRSKKKAGKMAEKPSPHDECLPKRHINADGNLIVPFEVLFGALRGGGRFVRLEGKRMMSNATSSVIISFLQILGNEFVLYDPGLKNKDNRGKPAIWHPDTRRGKNPNSNDAVAICRPCVSEWYFDVLIAFDSGEVQEAQVRELFDKTGAQVGIFDYRPARNGFCGRFRVDGWADAQAPGVNPDVTGDAE